MVDLIFVVVLFGYFHYISILCCARHKPQATCHNSTSSFSIITVDSFFFHYSDMNNCLIEFIFANNRVTNEQLKNDTIIIIAVICICKQQTTHPIYTCMTL